MHDVRDWTLYVFIDVLMMIGVPRYVWPELFKNMLWFLICLAIVSKRVGVLWGTHGYSMHTFFVVGYPWLSMVFGEWEYWGPSLALMRVVETCWNSFCMFLSFFDGVSAGIQCSCAICRHPLKRQPGLVLPPGKDRKPWDGGKNLKQEAGDQTEAGELGSRCIPNNGQQMAAVWTAIIGGVFQGNWQQRPRGVHRKKPSRHGLELPWIHFSQERLKGTVARFTLLTVETMFAIKCGARTDRSKMPWHWLATGLGNEASLGDGVSLAFLVFYLHAKKVVHCRHAVGKCGKTIPI